MIVSSENQLARPWNDHPAGGLLGLGALVYYRQLEMFSLQTLQRTLLIVSQLSILGVVIATFSTGDECPQHNTGLLQALRDLQVKLSILSLKPLLEVSISVVSLGGSEPGLNVPDEVVL